MRTVYDNQLTQSSTIIWVITSTKNWVVETINLEYDAYLSDYVHMRRICKINGRANWRAVISGTSIGQLEDQILSVQMYQSSSRAQVSRLFLSRLV
jgi:hypothetical protein